MYFASPVPRGAYKVLSTVGWLGQNPNFPDYVPYQWLPNGDLVHLEKGPHGRLQLCYQKTDSEGPTEAPRRGLEVPPDPYLPQGSTAFKCFSSPDEQWVACTWYSGSSGLQTQLISADGKVSHTLSQPFLQWLSDSRSFLTQSTALRPTIEVHHLDSPQVEVIQRITFNEGNLPVTNVSNGPDFLIGGRISHLPNVGSSTNYPTMTLRSFRVAQPDAVPETWQVQAPHDIDYGTVVASPNHRHLLWTVGTFRPTPLSALLHRLLPSHELVTVAKTYRFLSDLQGNHLHTILENTTDPSIMRSDGTRTDPELSIVWTPDSKHLSFIYQKQLYYVPVE